MNAESSRNLNRLKGNRVRVSTENTNTYDANELGVGLMEYGPVEGLGEGYYVKGADGEPIWGPLPPYMVTRVLRKRGVYTIVDRAGADLIVTRITIEGGAN